MALRVRLSKSLPKDGCREFEAEQANNATGCRPSLYSLQFSFWNCSQSFQRICELEGCTALLTDTD